MSLSPIKAIAPSLRKRWNDCGCKGTTFFLYGNAFQVKCYQTHTFSFLLDISATCTFHLQHKQKYIQEMKRVLTKNITLKF